MEFKNNEKIKVFLLDFNKFLDYLCIKEVTLGKATKHISTKFLFEMNEIMSNKQQEVTAKSNQLAYPMLHLFYSLVVENKLFVEQKIKSGKLALIPTERVEMFKQLNDLEKYFSLLEMLWVDCDFEKLEFQSYGKLNVHKVVIKMEIFKGKKSNKVIFIDEFTSDISTLLLYLSYFGIMDVKEDEEIKLKYNMSNFFCIRQVILTPVGEKIIKILDKKRSLQEWNIQYRKECDQWEIEFEEEFAIPFKGMFTDIEIEKTLPRRKIEFKDGIYTFKVSLDKGIWSKIQLSAQDTLHDLHDLIQKAFDFDNDHMYSFFMDGKPWSKNAFKCPLDDDGPRSDEVKIGELELTEKQDFLYIFDFGDDWRFNIEVFQIQNEPFGKFKPQIIESKGKSPQQYPDYE